ncbi:MAG TPA: glycosyltransferase, partial [Thermoanaerobaculia bacterium]|nr:glycosyltransferase [Thermoanaerobaculia bacterium]
MANQRCRPCRLGMTPTAGLQSPAVLGLDGLRRLLRPRPVDWNRGAGRAIAPRPDGVDVVIPVYGAADALRDCLASVLRETDLTRHSLVIALDGPQEREVEEAIRQQIGSFAHEPSPSVIPSRHGRQRWLAKPRARFSPVAGL